MSKKIKLNRPKAKEKIKLFKAALGIENDPFSQLAQISDPFSKLAEINIKGDKEIIIDGCYGIIEYSDTLISVSIGKPTLKIMGFDLVVSDYFDSNITVTGIIKSIEFC